MSNALSEHALKPNFAFDRLSDEHRVWLKPFDMQYLKNWEKNLAAEYETAMAEAAVRRMLQGHGATVEPNESLTGKSKNPDFACIISEQKFYVEVACITIAEATQATGISTDWNGGHLSTLTEKIFRLSKDKAPQCANLDAPCLVAIGTFHYNAAFHCFFDRHRIADVLTGTPYVSIQANLNVGMVVGPATSKTDCDDAALLKPDTNTNNGFARNSISGLLLCGLDMNAPDVIGLLHPNPVRSFNSALLPDIAFGEVFEDELHRLFVSWNR